MYEKVLKEVAADVKGGLPVSEAMRKHPEIPGIVVAMLKIGEETGNMGQILDTMARFYRREVNNAVDTLVGLIEPFMIVALAVGVAGLLASVLVPIYNIAQGFESTARCRRRRFDCRPQADREKIHIGTSTFR